MIMKNNINRLTLLLLVLLGGVDSHLVRMMTMILLNCRQ